MEISSRSNYIFLYALVSCEIPNQARHIVKECNAAYSVVDEDNSDYLPGWYYVTDNFTRKLVDELSVSLCVKVSVKLNVIAGCW